MPHTIQEDFEHFLAYSGFAVETEEVKAKLFQAYEANWEPAKQDLSTQSVWDIAMRFAGTQQVNNQGALVFETPQAFADCFRDVLHSVSVTAAQVAHVVLADPTKWTITHNGKSVTAENISKCALLARKLRTPEEEARANIVLHNAVDQLQEETTQEELDAAAYRWLRKQHENFDAEQETNVALTWCVFQPNHDRLDPVPCDPGELDRQIHAQIAKEDK